MEPQATHGLSSFALGFLPCGQTALRYLLACSRLGETSEARLLVDISHQRFHYGAISDAPDPMPNLSIKNVPAEIVGKLHERAAANHRSLQGELLALVTAAVSEVRSPAADIESRRLRHGHKSIEQIAAEHLERVREPVTKGQRSVEMIRADRDAR